MEEVTRKPNKMLRNSSAARSSRNRTRVIVGVVPRAIRNRLVRTVFKNCALHDLAMMSMTPPSVLATYVCVKCASS